MIANNYLRHPEALRFQRELFHNGYKNQPRIMRAMECIFNFAASVPGWVKEAARRARLMVKAWKAAQIIFNFRDTAPTRMRLSIVGYVHGNGPNGKTPKFEALLKTGRTWESIVADDDYFKDV